MVYNISFVIYINLRILHNENYFILLSFPRTCRSCGSELVAKDMAQSYYWKFATDVVNSLWEFPVSD